MDKAKVIVERLHIDAAHLHSLTLLGTSAGDRFEFKHPLSVKRLA